MVFPPIRLQQAWNFGGMSTRELLTRTWKKIQEHELMTRAAAVAFYAMLALVPFIALVITLAVKALPDLSSRHGGQQVNAMAVSEFQDTLRSMLPPEGSKIVEDQIKRIQDEGAPVGFLALGLLVTIWLASSLFVAVIDAMNAVYGVNEERPFWKLRLTAIVMTLVQAIILLGALVSIVIWPQLVGWLGLGVAVTALATAVQWFVIFIMLLTSFALTFYIAPNADRRWEWITPGSFIGTAAFLIATYGFRLYVQHFADYNKTYGSLGGVMVLLFWFWVSSLILLAAGQMNKVIEDAAPLGKKEGQQKDTTEPPDWATIPPEPATEAGPERR